MDTLPDSGGQKIRETAADESSASKELLDGRHLTAWSKTFRAVTLLPANGQGTAGGSLAVETDRIILPPSSLDAILNLPSFSFSALESTFAGSKQASPGHTPAKSAKNAAPDDDSTTDDEDEEEKGQLLTPPNVTSAIPQSSASIRPELPTPLNFQLVNQATGRVAYAGVTEFSAKEGTVQLQPRTATSLQIEANAFVLVRLVVLPKATDAKFRPLSKDFRDIPDVRVAFEAALRQFSTLAQGDVLTVFHGGKPYQFAVEGLSPATACSVTDTDVSVDVLPVEAEDHNLQNDSPAQPGHFALHQSNDDVEGRSLLPEAKLCATGLRDGDVHYFSVKDWKGINGVIKLKMETGDADVFASHNKKTPGEADWTWAAYGDEMEKCVVVSTTATDGLRDTNDLAENCNTLYIAVRSCGDMPADYSITWTLDTSAASHIEQVTRSIEASVRQPGFVQCQNCHAWILERTAAVHMPFCARNNELCEWGCGLVVRKSEKDKHWHCPECQSKTGMSGMRGLAKHRRWEHEQASCADCGASACSLSSLARHRRFECPERLHTCRFCRTYNRTGPPSYGNYRHLEMGLSEHEAACGARTIVCIRCNQLVRLMDVKTHAKLHEIERQAQPLPFRMCRNRMCTRPAAGSERPFSSSSLSTGTSAVLAAPLENPLGLCAMCYSPLYVSDYDPQRHKLLQRLAARYHSQLTVGCGRQWCRNPYCASGSTQSSSSAQPPLGDRPPGGGGPMDPTTAATALIPLLGALNKPNVPVWLCTDESAARKRAVLAAVVSLLGEDAFAPEWIVRAIEVLGDSGGRLVTEEVVRWLNANAPNRVRRRIDA